MKYSTYNKLSFNVLYRIHTWCWMPLWPNLLYLNQKTCLCNKGISNFSVKMLPIKPLDVKSFKKTNIFIPERLLAWENDFFNFTQQHFFLWTWNFNNTWSSSVSLFDNCFLTLSFSWSLIGKSSYVLSAMGPVVIPQLVK